MSRKSNGFRNLLALAVVGAAAAGTYYYLKKKETCSDHEAESGNDTFDEYDDFSDEDLNDAAEPEHEEKNADADMHKADDNRSYVSLDLKAAREKADAILENVSEKAEDTIQKIKSSQEFGHVANKVEETIHKIKNSEEFEHVTGKINETVDRIKHSNEYANVDEQMEHALHKVKEATEKAASKVGIKISDTLDAAEEMMEHNAADTMKDAAKATADTVKDTAETAYDTMKDAAVTTADTVREAAGTIADAAKDGAHTVADTLEDTADQILEDK